MTPVKDMTVLSITLNDDLERHLKAFCAESGATPEEAIVDALARKLKIYRFRRLQEALAPYARAAGYTSEEDLLDDIS